MITSFAAFERQINDMRNRALADARWDDFEALEQVMEKIDWARYWEKEADDARRKMCDAMTECDWKNQAEARK